MGQTAGFAAGHSLSDRLLGKATMKKCPFCAEDIQDEAIKCKHCGEFLVSSPPRRIAEEKIPWYFRTAFIVLALSCVGPLALPLIWWRPQTSLAWKIGLTIAILAMSWVLFRVSLESWHSIQEYYQLMESL